MAEIVHFSKQDATIRTGAAGDTNAQEVTQYTVSWGNLTGAGFANGDDVLVLVKFNIGASSASNNAEATFGVGTTFAGRSVLATMRTESDDTNETRGAREQMWMDRRTLVTDENFYTSIRIIATSTPNIEDFCFFIIKLDDLAADDFRYGEHTATGNQSDTPDDGATVTLPASGGDDWLVIATADWLVDSTSANGIQQLSLGGDTRQQLNWEGEDTAETLSYGNIGYLPAAANSAVCKVVKSVDTASTHNYNRSAIFALRMEAFADHVGAYSAGPVAMGGVIDTYVETNTVSLALTSTGNVAWFGQTIADITNALHEPFHRVQVNDADIVSALGRRGSPAYGTTEQNPVSQFGTISMSSGTLVIDMDCAEDINSTAYNFTDSSLVAFSMELAAGGITVTPGVAALVLATFVAVVTATANITVTPTTQALALATFAPTVTASNHQTVTPPTATLALASFAPSIAVSDNKTVTPTTAALVTSAFEPTVTTTAHRSVTPTTAALTLETFVPSVAATEHQTVTPTTAALSLTSFAPTVTGGAGVTVTPNVAILTTVTFAPTITITAHQTVTPGTKDLSLTTFAPTITIADHQTVIPSTGALTLTTFVPTIIATANQTIIPGHITLIFTMFAPTVTASEEYIYVPKVPCVVVSDGAKYIASPRRASPRYM